MAYTENEIFNLVNGSEVTGESPYDLWKSLGNEGTAQDFLNYLKDDGESNVSEETLAQIEQNKNDISQLTETVNDLLENGTGTGEGISSTIKQAIATILDAVLIDTNKQTSASEALAKIKAWAYGGTAEVLVSQTGSVLTLSNVTDITSITQTGTKLVLA